MLTMEQALGAAKESISRRPTRPGRLSGKIAVITGSAQGFGLGIAMAMHREGASVVIADINEKLAASVAGELGGYAASCRADVSDEGSVEQMAAYAVERFGGIDILVSNAGVLRAGGLDEMDAGSFEFVTRINYTGYFLCTKVISQIMRAQHEAAPERYFDIIQINSKSGLEGSKKNFAYAGGKFGGIGLTQSFALELIPYNIKVNAICPGNYYDGPLWSDPEKGLFVQYLNAGKVPGANTVEEVRAYYLSKSPIARGCDPEDVARAVFYCVEQEYETGQAVPVTGGQIMLS